MSSIMKVINFIILFACSLDVPLCVVGSVYYILGYIEGGVLFNNQLHLSWSQGETLAGTELLQSLSHLLPQCNI